MSERRETLQKHEEEILNLFVAWYNEKNDQEFVILERPDPPDAIIKNEKSETVRWIEVTDAFYSPRYAQDLYSYATNGEEHAPMEKGFYVNMDKQFSQRFVLILQKKLFKRSYEAVFRAFGPGVLIVAAFSPWFNIETVEEMKEEAGRKGLRSDMGYFDEVYLAFRSQGTWGFDLFEFPIASTP